MKLAQSRAAFTLLEIMVVVVIIGILTTIVVVKARDHVNRAKITATEASIAGIRTAIGNYEMEHSQLPDSLVALVTGEKHYLDQETVPTDGWGKEFKFYLKGDLVKVQSAGADGVFDTEDDVVNK